MSRPPGRVLAVDLGRVRIGLALSDPLGVSLRALEPLARRGPKSDLRRLLALVEDEEARTVVVGWPLHLSGEVGEAAREAESFVARLREEAPELDVKLWDERLTTVEAERVLITGAVRRKRRRQLVDGIAASLILRGYLDAVPAADEPS